MNVADYFSEGVSPAFVSFVECSGTEREVLDCSHLTSTQGLSCEKAGVVCQGMSTYALTQGAYYLEILDTVYVEASNCSTGDVRLVGSGDGDEGRLEVCVNKAWGTVCSDEFDTTDASVACGTIEGFSGNGKLATLDYH